MLKDIELSDLKDFYYIVQEQPIDRNQFPRSMMPIQLNCRKEMIEMLYKWPSWKFVWCHKYKLEFFYENLTSFKLCVPYSGIGWVDDGECRYVIEMTSFCGKPEREVWLKLTKACQGEMEANTTQIFHPHWFVVHIFQHIPITQKLCKINYSLYLWIID